MAIDGTIAPQAPVGLPSIGCKATLKRVRRSISRPAVAPGASGAAGITGHPPSQLSRYRNLGLATQVEQFIEQLLCGGNDPGVAAILGGGQHEVDQVATDVGIR